MTMIVAGGLLSHLLVGVPLIAAGVALASRRDRRGRREAKRRGVTS